MIIVDYRGPKLIQSLAQRFNISIFDRVTEVNFHSGSSLKDFDLTVFRELEHVSKPLKWVAVDQGTLSQTEYSQKIIDEMDRQAPLQAQSELSHSFSKCEIASIEKENMVWRAEVTPGVFTCPSSSMD